MTEQRKLLFNQNAPSGIIREKGREKERELSNQPESAVGSVSKMTQTKEDQNGNKAASSQSKVTATKGKSKTFHFRSKKKDKDATDPGIGAAEEAATKKGKKARKESAGKKNKKEGKSATVKESRVNGGGSRIVAEENEVNQITSIDEDDVSVEVSATEDIGLPKTNEHHKQTPPTAHASLEQSQISHQRSRSYEGEDEAGEKAGEGACGKLSKSQSNLSNLDPASKVKIASNLKVKKSGVVKEMPSQRSGRRTSLEVFAGGQEESKIGSVKLSKSQSNISSTSTSAGMIENLKVKKSGVVKGVTSHNSGRRVSLEMFGALKSTREMGVETEATDGPLSDESLFAPARRGTCNSYSLSIIGFLS